MAPKKTSRLKTYFCALALLALSACSGGGGGIIGTGIVLEGTTTSNRAYANNTIEVRSMNGARSNVTFNAMGRYTTEELNSSSGPWLVRAQLGDDAFLYGIATHADEQESVAQNIHSYSDAVARNWFANRGLDIDAVFAGEGTPSSVPTASELTAIRTQLNAVIADVLDEYQLGNTDLSSVEFAANGGAVDDFLTENPVIINNGNITIIINNPGTNTQSVATQDIDIATGFYLFI